MKTQTRTAAGIALAAGVLAATAVPSLAQMPAAPSLRVGAGAYHEAYTFGNPDAANIKTLSLTTLPFGVRVPLMARTSVSLTGSYAAGSMVQADGSEINLSGLTDTELSLAVPFGTGAFSTTVTGIVALPTGHATHSPAEARVAGVIAADLLPFRISNWGSGAGAGMNVAAVRAFNGGSFGLSAGYLVGREFEPSQADQFTYRPGNQLQVRAALDRQVGAAGKITASLLFQQYSEDVRDGTNLFQAGNRYQAIGSYAFAVGGGSSGILYAGGLHRDQGTLLIDPDRGIPSQNLLLAGAGLRMPMGGGVLLPSVDARLFRSADGVGQGYLTGVGASWERRAGTVMLTPTLRARFGSVLVREGSESGLVGSDVGLAVRFGR